MGEGSQEQKGAEQKGAPGSSHLPTAPPGENQGPRAEASQLPSPLTANGAPKAPQLPAWAVTAPLFHGVAVWREAAGGCVAECPS